MVEPKHPTAQYIEGRIAFHESGAEYYQKHGETKLAAWSREQMAIWTEKLTGRESGDGE